MFKRYIKKKNIYNYINRNYSFGLVVLIVAITIIRPVLPTLINYFYYPLIIFSFLFFSPKVFSDRKKIISFFKGVNLLYILLLFFFIIGIWFYFNTYLFKELIKGIIVLLIIMIIVVQIDNKLMLKKFFQNLFKVLLYLISLISILQIVSSFLVQIPGFSNFQLRFQGKIDVMDYNFNSLIYLIGLVLVIQKSVVKLTKYERLGLIFLFFSFIINIILSGSRRGVFFLGFVYFILIILLILSRLKRVNSITISKDLRLVLFSTVLIGILSWILFVNFSPQLKYQLTSNVNNPKYFRQHISYSIGRYFSLSTYKVQSVLWDNKYPIIINYLYHEKVKNFFDYMFLDYDKNYLDNGNFENSHRGWKVNSNLTNYSINKDNDTNFIILKLSSINQGFYKNFDVPNNTEIEISCFVFIEKWNRNLRLMSYSNGTYKSIYFNKDWEKDNFWHKISLKIRFSDSDIPRFYILGGGDKKISISLWRDFRVEIQPHIISSNDVLLVEKHPLVDNISVLDIEYDCKKKYSYKVKNDNFKKKELAVYSESNHLFIKREERLKFAMEMYLINYNWLQKICGNGFGYLEKFGIEFFGNKNRIDYPHNPIISSFLYSGLVGGLSLIFYLIVGIRYYWKYRKEYLFMGFLYCFIFVFSMMSGNSYFSIPIFTLFAFFPFVMKFFEKNSFK